ncbi:MAG: hypothetical protein FWG93_02305, partial [Oscillospiraceae bacterium]|nr:hypothetical protein [Oscillospiraceae bacterium]
MKKQLSFILALAMIASLVLVAAPAAMADTEPSATFTYVTGGTGQTASLPEVIAGLSSTYEIELSAETDVSGVPSAASAILKATFDKGTRVDAMTTRAFKISRPSTEDAAGLETAYLVIADDAPDNDHWWNVLANVDALGGGDDKNESLKGKLTDLGYTGYWGPKRGRNLSSETHADATFYFFAEDAGAYCIDFAVVDATAGVVVSKQLEFAITAAPDGGGGGGDDGEGDSVDWDATSGRLPATGKFQTATLAEVEQVALTTDKWPTLNLKTEKLVPVSGAGNFSIAGFAINGKWKAGSPTDKDIAKLFNSGGTLAVTNKMSDKPKDGPHKGTAGKAEVLESGTVGEPGYVAPVAAVAGSVSGYVITYAKIEKRPKALKLNINYALAADYTGETNGAWTLTEKGKATAYEKLSLVQISAPADGKKLAATDTFSLFTAFAGTGTTPQDAYNSELGGIGVKNMVDGKAVKTTYFIQEVANKDGEKYTPATKASKVTASSIIKAPNAKPNYKTGDIKPKAGWAVSTKDPLITYYAKSPNADATKGLVTEAVPAKDKLPKLADISQSITGVETTPFDGITVFAYAIEKKPMSAKLYIKVATPAAAPTSGVSVNEKGKVTLDKTLEARPETPADAKWGKAPALAAPANAREDIFIVRLKGTAKPVKAAAVGANGDMLMGFEGNSASPESTVKITWTVTGTGKDATVSSTVAVAAIPPTPPPTPTPLILLKTTHHKSRTNR